MTFFQKRWRGFTLLLSALKTVRMLQEKSECAGELGRTFGFLVPARRSAAHSLD
jgi:hypothetical protein